MKDISIEIKNKFAVIGENTEMEEISPKPFIDNGILWFINTIILPWGYMITSRNDTLVLWSCKGYKFSKEVNRFGSEKFEAFKASLKKS